MSETSTMLSPYVRLVRVLLDAEHASLYVPSFVDRPQPGCLLHDGGEGSSPELATLDSAAQFAEGSGGRFLSRLDGEVLRSPVLLASADPSSILVWVPSSRSARSASRGRHGTERRRSALARPSAATLDGAWLALCFSSRTEIPATLVESLTHPDTGSDPVLTALFALGGVLTGSSTRISSILADPISGLGGRAEFSSLLQLELANARATSSSAAVLFINPDEFQRVNNLFGQANGDQAVRQISDRLIASQRDEDLLVRYGGVTFATLLVGLTEDAVTRVAQRLLRDLSEEPYLEDAVQLDFSIGVALYDPVTDDPSDPLDLVQRADQALSLAKRGGGGRVVRWEPAGGEQLESFDRMAGIFTGHVAKDYRNMLLLWNIVDIVASSDEIGSLAVASVRSLSDGLKAQRVGLFWRNGAGEVELLAGCVHQVGPDTQETLADPMDVDSRGWDLIQSSMNSGQVGEALSEETSLRHYVIPLSGGENPLGALFLEWDSDTSGLDVSDRVFIGALGSQLGMALERIRLGEWEAQRQETEKRQLRAELRELRDAVHRAKMVYRSPEMEAVMETARRVAGSDATVLITGPSGTGKELMARTVHELSPRREGPFVIVDCGSIPTTLIESELFGHEKGAYTGAGTRSIGMIARAKGGTVLFDEIGELPLEVQSKLLRFVQDRVFKSVGGTELRRVDARIIAATNRDLAREVAEGRFREDLYFRLNVIHLQVPPLADRPTDIELLAHHFLDLYSVQYQKPIQGFSGEAERSLLEHPWPGNIRELQNRVMRAVLLCEGGALSSRDLGLDANAPATSDRPFEWAGPDHRDTVRSVASELEAEEEPYSVSSRIAHSSDDDLVGRAMDLPIGRERLLEELAERLGRQLESVLDQDRDPPPLGRWLRDDLLLMAFERSGGVLARAAAALGLPKSTYRRRLLRARRVPAGMAATRPLAWRPVAEIAQRLVMTSPAGAESLPDHAEQALLRQVVRLHPDNTRVGAALVGVTPPTYRRRVAQLEAVPETGLRQ